MCEADQFRCNDGLCIELGLRCNRVADCYDRTDEIGCVNTSQPLNRTNTDPVQCDGVTQIPCQV